jgi:hypothetical protein
MSIFKADRISVPCDCCGRAAPRLHASQEWGICGDCTSAGCSSKSDGEGGMLRGARCPLVVAGPDVVMCLHCAKPLHKSEPLTFVNNANPGLGGCHARCVDAYHAAKRSVEG